MKAIQFITIICIILYSNISNAQSTRIIEILGTNLFLTKDSLKIKMANLDVPSQNDIDSSRRVLAQRIMTYNRLNLRNKSIRIVMSPDNPEPPDQIKRVHLFKKYPLYEQNVNIDFIEKGYAFYVPADTFYKEDYIQAARYATKHEMGVWKGSTPLKKTEMLNRLRATFWIYQLEFRTDRFIPIIGLNYRWSGLYKVIDEPQSTLSLSAEAGTWLYFVLPYTTLGAEYRYKDTYIRGHYDILLAGLSLNDIDEADRVGFWGADIGFITMSDKRAAFEIELNLKFVPDNVITLMSINLTVY